MAVVLKYIDFNIQTDLKMDKNGYLDPYIKQCMIDIGKSTVEYDSHVVEFIAHETLDLMLVIIEQSVEFIGEYVFTHTLGPLIDTYTNHYQFQFWWWSQWPGQWAYDTFKLDARMVRDPVIDNAAIDFFMAGDLIYGDEGCILKPDPDLDFVSDDEQAMSQIVMSDSAASCWMN